MSLGRWVITRLRRTFSVLLLVSILSIVVVYGFYGIKNISLSSILNSPLKKSNSVNRMVQYYPDGKLQRPEPVNVEQGKTIIKSIKLAKDKTYEETIDNLLGAVHAEHKSETLKPRTLNYNVHLFYYAWYGNPQTDGRWWHWNHKYIPPWDKTDHHKYPTGHHVPPTDIGSNFYPKLGPYSSRDTSVIAKHMEMISAADVGVISVSWYPPGMADENGPPTDEVILLLLDQAVKFGIKVCLHTEPYLNRTVENLHLNLAYVHICF